MMDNKEEKIGFPLPITAALLKSLPLTTSSPNHDETPIVVDDPNLICDVDHTTAAAAAATAKPICSLGNMVTLFRLNSGTFVEQVCCCVPLDSDTTVKEYWALSRLSLFDSSCDNVFDIVYPHASHSAVT